MKYVRYQHITNPKRVGEVSHEIWEQKSKLPNFSLYWKKIEEFDKSKFVPEEAQVIEKAKKITKND